MPIMPQTWTRDDRYREEFMCWFLQPFAVFEDTTGDCAVYDEKMEYVVMSEVVREVLSWDQVQCSMMAEVETYCVNLFEGNKEAKKQLTSQPAATKRMLHYLGYASRLSCLVDASTGNNEPIILMRWFSSDYNYVGSHHTVSILL